MATTAIPRNKVLSVMLNLLSYKKSEKNGNKKQVQQVSGVLVRVVLSIYQCILFSLTIYIVTAFTLHNTGFEWCRGSARS